MREEFGEGAGLSVLSLRLVAWWIQVLLELAFKISLVTTSDSSKNLVYIVLHVHNSLLSVLFSS